MSSANSHSLTIMGIRKILALVGGRYDRRMQGSQRRHHDNRRDDVPAQRDGEGLEIRQRRFEQRMERQPRC